MGKQIRISTRREVFATGTALLAGIGCPLTLAVADEGSPLRLKSADGQWRALDRAALREGPDEMARLARELPEGSSVRILGREAGFMHVRLGEREGYLLPADVGEI